MDIYLTALNTYIYQTFGNISIDILVSGGSALIIGHNFRQCTEDIDTYIKSNVDLSKCIKAVSRDYSIPDDWMNSDFVKSPSFSIKLTHKADIKSYGCLNVHYNWDFRKSSEIAQLGFTLFERNSNKEYLTQRGTLIHLKYIFDMPCNRNYPSTIGVALNLEKEMIELRKNCSSAVCFGDFASWSMLCGLKQLVNLYGIRNDGDYKIAADKHLIKLLKSKESLLTLAETLLILMSIYNKELALLFCKTHIDFAEQINFYPYSKKIESIASSAPKELHKDLELYYKSGYCVYKNNGKHRKHKNDILLNYRSLGGNADHQDIIKILLPEVMKHSSCKDVELMKTIVSNLRFYFYRD